MDDDENFILNTRLSNLGIEISYGPKKLKKPLEPSRDADQVNPRGHYVYAHLDAKGNIFYIGEGVGRRAWSENRHDLWYRYVEKHLNGKYRVQILIDNLCEEDAEYLENVWMAQCGGENLVNWITMARHVDLHEVERYHSLRNANRRLIQEARPVEKDDLEKASAMYVKAIDAIGEYASIHLETGLVGKLMEEEATEFGINGELEALDRLSLCLIKLNRPQEAANRADAYFALYRRDLHMSAALRITKRIQKALPSKK